MEQDSQLDRIEAKVDKLQCDLETFARYYVRCQQHSYNADVSANLTADSLFEAIINPTFFDKR